MAEPVGLTNVLLELDTTNAQDGTPMRVRVAVAHSSIAVRIQDDLILVARPRLTLKQGATLVGQLRSLGVEGVA